MKHKRPIKAVLLEGVRTAVYPGAVLLVAREGQVVFHAAAGKVSTVPIGLPVRQDTIFDLASLTKPLATTMAIMKLVTDGAVHLDQSLAELLEKKISGEKGSITLRQLLSHSAGFPDWRPFYLELVRYEPGSRKRVVRNMILKEPLVFPPGSRCLYSDLGFMMLEWAIEAVTQLKMHEFVYRSLYTPLSLMQTCLSGTRSVNRQDKGQCAATENCQWRKRVIQGEVHDENAFSLGGYSGHAGLFGTAIEVYRLLELLRTHYTGEREDVFRPQVVRSFFERQGIADGTTWALGWDTPSGVSSSGKYFSTKSVGHLGFTGTSIWMDLEKDVIVILLTNRIHPTRENEKIRMFRPTLHDTVMEALGKAY